MRLRPKTGNQQKLKSPFFGVAPIIRDEISFAIYIRNYLRDRLLRMEPVVGFEPTTDGLQNRCSTTELNWRLKWARHG